jgi:hypothetical protein
MLQAGRSPVRVPDEVDFSIYLILPAVLWPWCRLSLQQKWVPGIFLGPGCRADNLAAICQPIVWKMWEPQPLAILRASTACRGITLTFYVYTSRFLVTDLKNPPPTSLLSGTYPTIELNSKLGPFTAPWHWRHRKHRSSVAFISVCVPTWWPIS